MEVEINLCLQDQTKTLYKTPMVFTNVTDGKIFCASQNSFRTFFPIETF